MRALELSQKVYCLMDDDTYDWLRYWKWSLAVNANETKYARRLCTNPFNQKRMFVYMHKIIAGVSLNYRMSFRD